MVAIGDGEVLYWDGIKNNLEEIRAKQVKQLIRIYNKHKDIAKDPFKWGDEMELSLVKFDHENKKCYLLLKSEEFFAHIDKLKEDESQKEVLDQCEFHNEYTSYIIETIPGRPSDDDVNSLAKIQDNVKLRRQTIQNFLGKDEHVICLTSFPLLGCTNFTYPHHNPTDLTERYNSQFYSNNIIMNEALFFSATYCKVDRVNSQPQINIPIFKDEMTPSPFIEELPNKEMSKPDQIFMDHDGFAMGCCCIQVTFQGESLDDACHLYDQLTPMGPIILALSASSPIWRGYLSDVDCRWDVLKQCFDDRTKEELGEEPLKENRRVLKKCRLDATDVYLSKEGAKYNDFEFDKDETIYEQLIGENLKEGVANHFANIFTRDPILLYKADALGEDRDETDTASFDFFNCSNWRILRFKPPPIKSEDATNHIGWRVEFRPTELQFSDFENSAFASFIILLTRTISAFKLNLLIGTSKVADNMGRATKRNACMDQKFYFRQNVTDKEDCQLVELTINEILNGNDTFKGLLYYVNEYLKTQNMTDETKFKVESYLNLFKLRAIGVLKTPATWIREFVMKHPKYEQDSRINEEINYDLMWSIYQMSMKNVVFDAEDNKISFEN